MLRLLAVASLFAVICLPVLAQPPEATPPPGEPTAPTDTTQQPASQPSPQPQQPTPPPAPTPPAAGTTGSELPPRPPGGGGVPRLDVFFPEGDLDLRVGRLVNKVFFEGQVKYNFISGDITAFLRYRYYSLRQTTQLTVFDSIQFDDIDETVTDDFERTRGGLLLLQWPHSYSRRTSFLAELDKISTNKPTEEERLTRIGHTNTFVRYSFQFGTPDDGPSNAIVGEPRARTERLFSAFRDIGPGGAGFTGALAYSNPNGFGDYDYVKLQIEALKRFDITQRSFLIGRLRGGSFPHAGTVEAEPGQPPPTSPEDTLRIPRSEFFALDGRDGLLGLSERMHGTEMLLTTWEYFMPWFIEQSHNFLWLNWQNWYWILYTGAGTIGFDRSVYTDLSTYIPDAGVGFEASFNLRKYRFFLSGIVAQALKGSSGVEARISVKSYH